MTTLRPLKSVFLLAGLVGVSALAFWLGASYCDARRFSNDMRSGSRFGKIEGLLQMYHDKHGAFPPTKYQPVAGGPIHSWRVLLLVALGERRDYDFSLAWNSPTNLQGLGRISPFQNYFVQSEFDDGENTHFLSIGDDDEWPARKPLRSRLITKGKDRFLLVEYPDSKIHWMEPKY